ncbi:MAG: heme-binding protein [Rhodospirillales bacterium]|nr:heme-binding protein [Rhodospirillales bacterium]
MLNIKRLSQSDALQLIAGAEAKSREIGIPMCIAVTDEAGNLIAFSRMDGSKVLSISLSQDKAFSAAVSRRGTHEYNKLCLPGSLTFGIHTSAGGKFTVVGGGLPVFDGDDVIGGIGCSSGTAVEDRECAQAGIDNLNSR